MPEGGWRCLPDGPDAAIIYPLADLVHHTPGEDCVCGPDTRPVKRDDGSVGWLYVHRSLDGREHAEPA